MATKVERQELQRRLMDVLSKSAVFKMIEGVNPCLISFNGLAYYIYIKNLSSAYFTNSDIWRVQLPIREDFNDIKGTDIPFILFGYDSSNDVYTTWNPYWTKQRLNVAQSVSFYSRYSLQQEAGTSTQFMSLKLQNDGEVIAFSRNKAAYYLVHIEQFFPELSEYVAMGSKKRTAANDTYRVFNDNKNMPDFAHYLRDHKLQDTTIYNYCKAIRILINRGYISRNRKIFLAYDSIDEYVRAKDAFFSIPEINGLNEAWHRTYSAALDHYINFLIEDNHVINDTGEPMLVSPIPEVGSTTEERTSSAEKPDNIDETDWEVPFIDAQGKLIQIANPTLLDLLRPELDVEYKTLAKAYNIVEDFYGDKFSNMELRDWQKLFDQIDWTNPYYVSSSEELIGKRKTHILRVIFPNGTVIQERVVKNTLVEVVKKCNPALISEMGIFLAGINLVSKDISEKYEKSQIPIGDGYYVMTCCSTQKKQQIIETISENLDLGIAVMQIPIDETPQIK